MSSARALFPFLCCIPSLFAQSGVAWRKDYDTARAEAVREQKLMLVCFNHDGESASDQLAAKVYRHPRFRKACEPLVALVASPCRHQKTGDCPRFGALACADHQRVDGQAWHAIFGPLDTVIAPQHVLLFPDGRIAWHSVGDTNVSTLAEAIAAASAALKREDRHRIGLEQATLGSLVRRMKNSATDWLVARTLLAHARPVEFPELFALLDDAMAERMLGELAEFPAVVVQPLFASLSAKVHPRLSRQLADALLQVRAAAAQAEAAVRAKATSGFTEIQTPLPSLGKPDPIARVQFGDGEKRDLGSCRGRITVLWFFLPDATGLADDVAWLNQFAAECKDRPVAHLALGGSLDPEASLTLVRLQKFAVPAGAYRYDEQHALSGVTLFPTVVVLDPNGEIVYRGTSRSEYQALVRGMLVSPAYAGQLGQDGRR